MTKTAWIPTALTLGNLICGGLSIYCSVIGLPAVAVGLIIVAMIPDGFDGKAARHFDVVNKLGAELDSLCDAVSFGVAPFVLSITQFPSDLVVMVAGILFVCGGVYRLARYNILPKSPGFVGVPITANGFIFPVLVFIDASALFYAVVLIVMAGLMVSTLKVPRIL